MNNKNIITIASVSVVVIACVVIFFYYRKKKKQEEKERLEKAIDTGYKLNANSISDILMSVEPISYGNIQPDYITLKEAKGSFFGMLDDDEEAVYNVFKDKTLSNIKALENYFINEHGISLDQHLSFLSEEEMKKVKNIVLLAEK